jgi:hypothetical protein
VRSARRFYRTSVALGALSTAVLALAVLSALRSLSI